jgi:hypothetical protein
MVQVEPFYLHPGEGPAESSQTVLLGAGEDKEGVDLKATNSR